MRAFEVVAMVIIAFFVIGIGVGVLFAIALPGIRPRGRARRIGWPGEHHRRSDLPPGYGGPGSPGWEELTGPDGDDNPPRWPGGTSA